MTIDINKINKRLQEIAEIKFGEPSDDEILQLLAERKRLTELKREYERLQKEEDERLRKEQERLKKEEEELRRRAEEERLQKEKEEKERLQKEKEKRLALEKERTEKIAALKTKKQSLAREIEELNQAISPSKTDDDLLMFISQRKKLEKELQDIEAQLLNEPVEAVVEIVKIGGKKEKGEKVEKSQKAEKGEIGEENEGNGKKEEEVKKAQKIKEAEIEERQEKEAAPSFRESLKEEFGKEGIEEGLQEDGELHRYLNQLKNNTGSLGTLLQEMSADAKKNKAFMLQVAEIDPAYAMHYADNELKKNENFNIRVAFIRNPRNSGNALAEMLPEGRTSRVVLTAVKQDYRNVKFIQPNMEDYDEIMRIAKKAALEKLKDLKSAADMALVIPRPLQQDRLFMEEAKNIVAGEKKENIT